jgi:hypothetical protein
MSDEQVLAVLARMAEDAGDYAEADRLREPSYDQSKEV